LCRYQYNGRSWDQDAVEGPLRGPHRLRAVQWLRLLRAPLPVQGAQLHPVKEQGIYRPVPVLWLRALPHRVRPGCNHPGGTGQPARLGKRVVNMNRKG